MSNHARFAPSSMDANLICTGRVPLIEEQPVIPGDGDGGNIYSYEGTVAHAIAEQVLTTWWESDKDVDIAALLDAHDLAEWPYYIPELPEEFRKQVVDQEMLNYIADYINTVLDILLRCRRPELYIEKRVTIIEGQCYGTADVIIVDTNDLYVIDLKFGAGVAVDAFENMQALTYLVGALLGYKEGVKKPDRYHAIIIQPRIPSKKPYSEWVVNSDIMADHMMRIANMVNDVRDGNTHLKEGDHCRWCPVKVVCPRLDEVSRGMDLNHPPDRMIDSAISEALDWAVKAELYIKSLREYAHTRIEAGAIELADWKVVDKRATTKWKDDVDVSDVVDFGAGHGVLPSEATKTVAITPTQMGKLLSTEDRKAMLDELTVKMSSGTVLVAASDKRESAVKGDSKSQSKSQQLRAIALLK